MPPPAPDLPSILTSTLALLDTSITTLTSPTSTITATATASNNNVPALPLLADTAHLLRAHATKLSLLAITPPFTPSALATELAPLPASVLPSMLAAVTDAANPTTLGVTMVTEMRHRARRTLQEFRALVAMIDAKSTAGQQSAQKRNVNTAAEEAEKQKFTNATGHIWAACDACSALQSLGIPGLLAQKAAAQRELLEDALTELKEWQADAEDEGFSEDSSDGAQNEDEGEEEGLGLQKLTLGPDRLPSSREDVQRTLEKALRLLGLARTLFAAVVKHRFKTLVPGVQTEANVRRADEAMGALGRVPGEADELAGALYEFSVEGAEGRLRTVKGMCVSVVEGLEEGWEGERDAFAGWCVRFQEAVEGVVEREV